MRVAHDEALRTARGIDELLGAGVDLGATHGTAGRRQRFFSFGGMPTTAGSKLDISDLAPVEGPFIRALRRGGCVILGKARTNEFGVSMTNICHVQPWNPCDPITRRMPGRSSSGSAVAVAAWLCAFAVGTDTGGSVRQRAAHCGIFGFKASAQLWSRDGVFALSTAHAAAARRVASP